MSLVELERIVPTVQKSELIERGLVESEIQFQHIVWPYVAIVPLLYLVGAYAATKRGIFKIFRHKPRTNVWFVDGISASSRAVKDGATTFKALDVVYNFTTGIGSNHLIRAVDWFWIHVRNAQAVWNRLQIVRNELCIAIEKQGAYGHPVRILSIAAGSAQAVIEAMALMQKRGIGVEAVLVDASKEALKHAQRLAAQHGVGDSVRVVRCFVVDMKNGGVLDFEQKIDGFQPDIVEMAGLIDYLDDSQIVALFDKIYRLLKTGGNLITCHIHPNHESFFLLYVVDWWMRYRTKEQLRLLLEKGGFLSPKLVTEPHQIHTIAVGQRI